MMGYGEATDEEDVDRDGGVGLICRRRSRGYGQIYRHPEPSSRFLPSSPATRVISRPIGADRGVRYEYRDARTSTDMNGTLRRSHVQPQTQSVAVNLQMPPGTEPGALMEELGNPFGGGAMTYRQNPHTGGEKSITPEPWVQPPAAGVVPLPPVFPGVSNPHPNIVPPGVSAHLSYSQPPVCTTGQPCALEPS